MHEPQPHLIKQPDDLRHYFDREKYLLTVMMPEEAEIWGRCEHCENCRANVEYAKEHGLLCVMAFFNYRGASERVGEVVAVLEPFPW